MATLLEHLRLKRMDPPFVLEIIESSEMDSLGLFNYKYYWWFVYKNQPKIKRFPPGRHGGFPVGVIDSGLVHGYEATFELGNNCLQEMFDSVGYTPHMNTNDLDEIDAILSNGLSRKQKLKDRITELLDRQVTIRSVAVYMTTVWLIQVLMAAI